MKILLVEDDPGIAGFVERGLRVEGYHVEWVASAGEAFDAIQNNVTMAILDLGLPDLDGLSVCRAWRREHPELPILILSARDSVESKVAGLDAGADDYLTKPFVFEELMARVRALCRRHGKPVREKASLQLADLTLDPETREVQRAGQVINLTEREFLLLEYLLRNQGKVISRQAIVDSAWESDTEISDNAVDVYISYLRRKIDQGNARLIHTVRGVGFKVQLLES